MQKKLLFLLTVSTLSACGKDSKKTIIPNDIQHRFDPTTMICLQNKVDSVFKDKSNLEPGPCPTSYLTGKVLGTCDTAEGQIIFYASETNTLEFSKIACESIIEEGRKAVFTPSASE